MSRIRSLKTHLLIAAVIGAVLTYRAAQTHQELLAEKTRLEQKTGPLPITDPSKIHVRAWDTGEPLHFALRVYFPPGCESCLAGRTEKDKLPGEYVVRVCLRENNDGILSAFVIVQGCEGQGNSFMRVGLRDRQLTELLHDRTDPFQVEQLGCDEVVVVEPDEVAVLLRLSLSDQLTREVKQKLPNQYPGYYLPTLFDYRVGSTKAFQKVDAIPGPKQPGP